MAIITRSQSTVYGLESELLALQLADSTEQAARIAGDSTLQGNIDTEETARIAGDSTLQGNIDTEETARIAGDSALSGRLDVVEGDATTEGSIAKAESDAKAYADALNAAIDGDLTALTAVVTTINADSTTEGSFRKAIADVIGAAPEALDTLQEIAASLANDPDLDSTLRTLVSTNIESAKSEIRGAVTEAFDTLAEVETKLNSLDSDLTTAYTDLQTYADDAVAVEATRAAAAEATKLSKASNLSDLTDVGTARTNLDVYSVGEVNSLVNSGGATFLTEALVVTADKITLTNAPKNGVLFNFATVRHTDVNGVSYDIPATVTATAGGKEFLLSPNVSGEFDTKTVIVQYAYTA